jgi:hypothetical protein
MKKILLLVSVLALFQIQKTIAQSFTAVFPDTLVYGPTVDGSSLACWDGNWVKNISGAPLTLDILRVQDDTQTPGWTSAFCFYSCQAPFIDSLRYTMPTNDSVNMAVHLIITASPDSGTVIMKIKNVANPAETLVQSFHGVSQTEFGVHNGASNTADVKIYPSPVVTGTDFNMNITNIKSKNIRLSVIVYNIYGSLVRTINDLTEGSNTLNLNLAAGIYSYRLVSENHTAHSGKISIVK